jgi:hypothetical protein
VFDLDNGFHLGPFFAKRSTPAERLVIVWLLILLSLGVGLFCLYLGFTAPPTKAAAAHQLKLYGYGFLGFALLVWIVHRVIAWLIDR